MKVLGIIPARYKSSRFPGKPLADICGKPMIWWVYNRAIKAETLTEVYVPPMMNAFTMPARKTTLM